MTEKTDLEIEQDLIDRRIEIGVVTLPKPRLDTLPLAVDELVAVVPEKHELATTDPIDLRDLARHPLILTHAGSQELVARIFHRAGIQPNVTHELQQLISILEFVALGHGVSIVASLALPQQHKGVVYRKIVPHSTRHVGLACLNQQRLSPAAAALWQQVESSERRSVETGA